LRQDEQWLSRATLFISQHWNDKNARNPGAEWGDGDGGKIAVTIHKFADPKPTRAMLAAKPQPV